MKLINSLFILIFSFSLYSQENSETQLKEKLHDPLYGKNLEEAEKLLNTNIQKLNENMKEHSKILVTKIKVLPRNAVLYKGKLNGDECVESVGNQEDPENNCVKLEIFDFVEGTPKRPAFGPKSKFMVIGFEGDPSKEKNPRLASPRKVTLIRSRVLVDNLYGHDRKLVEVVDENPIGGDVNEIYILSQDDYVPENIKAENPSNLAYGKYKLSQMENSKISPLRNTFKREAYIKHLQSFNELFKKILEFNMKTNTKKMEQNTNQIKESFSY